MESRGETTAYGASLSGGSFDFVNFLKQPQTILRLLSWVFAIVVFATITAEGYVNDAHDSQVKCVFNQNEGACNYGVGIGIIAFFGAVAFLVADAYLPMMSSAQERRRLVIADLGFSGLWTFLWFVGFCLLANQWGKTTERVGIPTDAAQAVIAFAFFSIATWAGLTYFALVRFRQGVGDITQNFSESVPDHTSPYSSSYIPQDPSPYQASAYPSFPNARSDIYPQPPFTAKPEPTGNNDYQPPTY
ncbi:synaptogyrin-2b [Trichomycterus rosablanca]|uniref:synaptogyrin-2b n=1 Tax=Trichomycterus rosablanca TaxID=2290929 RepID=UPI002F352970